MMVTSPMTAGEAPTILAAQQAAWADALREMAPGIAYAATLAKELGQGDTVRVIGMQTAMQYRELMARFLQMFRVARKMDRREAALVAWHDTDEKGNPAGPTFLGVIDVNQIPAGGQLAGWPLLVLAAAVAIAVLIWKRWDVDLQQLREANRAIENTARQKLAQDSAALQQSDPALWGRLQIAMQNATAASSKAAANPTGFFDSLISGVGASVGFGIPPLVILGVLWALSKRDGRRAA